MDKVCKIIAVAMQKGGVGKTVSTMNLAASLAEKGHRVLAIDSDPQANLTYALGLDREDNPYTVPQLMYRVLTGELPEDLTPYITPAENFAILCGGNDLADIEVQLAAVEDRVESTRVLRKVVDGLRPLFDYILIDTLPSLGLLAINSMAAADSILIPCPAEMFGTEGLLQIIQSVQNMREYNPDVDIEGIFFTKYDQRQRVCREVVDTARNYFGESIHFFDTLIPYRADAGQSILHRQSALKYRRWGDLSRRYTLLAGEIMGRSGVVS